MQRPDTKVSMEKLTAAVERLRTYNAGNHPRRRDSLAAVLESATREQLVAFIFEAADYADQCDVLLGLLNAHVHHDFLTILALPGDLKNPLLRPHARRLVEEIRSAGSPAISDEDLPKFPSMQVQRVQH